MLFVNGSPLFMHAWLTTGRSSSQFDNCSNFREWDHHKAMSGNYWPMHSAHLIL